MSSSCGNGLDATDSLMTRRPKFDKSKQCIKCKTNGGNIVIRHAVYCKSCFTPLVSHKFRKSLDVVINDQAKSRKKALRASGNLCVAFSGGLCSAVLLDLVSKCYFQGSANMNVQVDSSSTAEPKGGTSHPRNENAWKKGYICYVDCSSALSELKDQLETVSAIAAKYPEFQFVPLRVEDAFDHDWWIKVGGNPLDHDLYGDPTSDMVDATRRPTESSTPRERLQAFISGLPTSTAISASLSFLTRLLLLYTSRSLACSHLVLGTSLTTLSISLISGIGQGGGFGVRDEPLKKVRISRPLRDIGTKECAIWAWWNNLAFVNDGSTHQRQESIPDLTRNFIVGLERDYPSTVSTIARTCSKLTPKLLDVSDGKWSHCFLCERACQMGVFQRWKDQIAISSFKKARVSSVHPSAPPAVLQYLLDTTEDDGDAEAEAEGGNTNHSPGLASYLCYSCHTTLTSRNGRSKVDSGFVPLPVWATSRWSTLQG